MEIDGCTNICVASSIYYLFFLCVQWVQYNSLFPFSRFGRQSQFMDLINENSNRAKNVNFSPAAHTFHLVRKYAVFYLLFITFHSYRFAIISIWSEACLLLLFLFICFVHLTILRVTVKQRPMFIWNILSKHKYWKMLKLSQNKWHISWQTNGPC